MTKYFYVKESQRFGPVSFEDLKKVNLTKETLVWFEGLEEWKKAKEIPELADLLIVKELSQSASNESLKNNDHIIPVPDQKLPTVAAIIQDEPATTSLVKSEFDDAAQVVNHNTPVDDFNNTNPSFSKQMMFATAFSFNGRIRRTEYWLTYIIANILIFSVGLVVGESSSGDNSPYMLMVFVPAIWLFLAQNTKRCHDRGNSGWYQLIPFYGLWMAFADGDRLGNQYGPSPKR